MTCSIFIICNMLQIRWHVFCSSLLGDLAFEWQRGWGDLALIQTSLLWSCKCTYNSIKTAWFTQQKEWGLYQNKVTSTLAAIKRPDHSADNCKIACVVLKRWETKWTFRFSGKTPVFLYVIEGKERWRIYSVHFSLREAISLSSLKYVWSYFQRSVPWKEIVCFLSFVLIRGLWRRRLLNRHNTTALNLWCYWITLTTRRIICWKYCGMFIVVTVRLEIIYNRVHIIFLGRYGRRGRRARRKYSNIKISTINWI